MHPTITGTVLAVNSKPWTMEGRSGVKNTVTLRDEGKLIEFRCDVDPTPYLDKKITATVNFVVKNGAKGSYLTVELSKITEVK